MKHNSDFFKNTLNPIIEPSQFEKDEALRFLDLKTSPIFFLWL